MEHKSKRYAPSWIDILIGWVDRLPGPAWSNYLELGFALFLLQLIILWAVMQLKVTNRIAG